MSRILVVDDDHSVLSAFEQMLADEDHTVRSAVRGEQVLPLIEEFSPQLVIMDVRLPGQSGLETLQQLHRRYPRLPVIIMTGYSTTDVAIVATKQGAFDYHIKPFAPPAMLRSIEHALECVRLMERQVALDADSVPSGGDALIGHSEAIRALCKAIGRVAETDATVLIRGETGTGKELVARAVYQHSRRCQAPLVVVNCVAIPETLLESELFGHERGAFTGAVSRRIGKFEQAHGGTLFLDEIGDVPAGVQAKLLRVLQEKTFERLGGSELLTTDVRVIAATNCNLESAMAEGRFREDLYHRLNVFTIDIPPLRERREDIPLLAAHFLRGFAEDLGTAPPVILPQAMALLQTHSWPGNVRELEHTLQRLLIHTGGYPIQEEHARAALHQGDPSASPPLLDQENELVRTLVQRYLQAHYGGNTHGELMEQVERALLTEALRLTRGNQTHAARLLGLARPTLKAKMNRLGLSERRQP